LSESSLQLPAGGTRLYHGGMLQSGRTTWCHFAAYLALLGVTMYATLLPWSAAMQQAAAITLAQFADDLAQTPCVSGAPDSHAVGAPALPAPQSDTCEICKAVGCSAFAVTLPSGFTLPIAFASAVYAAVTDDRAAALTLIAPRSRAPPALV
jgi:hypothetical protein